ncbi:MAG TPA: tetratricopeptide repeat protein, partial [Nitrospirae bacterium]|nr:tetratricopeptide repeat protein [Nitrospirota bacterium]
MDMKGRIYLAGKDYQSALSVYKAMAAAAPETGKQRMAGVYSAMGDYNRAIRELKGLLAGRTDRVDIQRQIVNLYIRKKDFKEAERYAREIISSNMESDKGYRALAAVYIADRRFQEAINSLKTAETLNPQNLETKVTLGKIYASTENFQKALETFKEVEKFKPYYAPVCFLLANTLEKMGRKKDAVGKHLKTLKLSPDYIPSLNNLAYLYAEGYGPVEEAVKLAQRAKKLAPENGSITDTLGWALFNKGDYDDALKQFIEATYYLPGEPAIRYHLGLAYLKEGMNDKAEEQLKNAVRLGRGSDFSELKDAEKALEGINRK